MSCHVSVVVVESAEQLSLAFEIRHRIFVVEQGIPAELDHDGKDEEAVHVLAYCDDEPVGTGRLFMHAESAGTLARIAVLPGYRGQRIARHIIQTLEREARARGAVRVVLNPHAALKGFYNSLGYELVEGEHTAGRYRLLTMAKALT